jgi:hypothetical protein
VKLTAKKVRMQRSGAQAAGFCGQGDPQLRLRGDIYSAVLRAQHHTGLQEHEASARGRPQVQGLVGIKQPLETISARSDGLG